MRGTSSPPALTGFTSQVTDQARAGKLDFPQMYSPRSTCECLFSICLILEYANPIWGGLPNRLSNIFEGVQNYELLADPGVQTSTSYTTCPPEYPGRYGQHHELLCIPSITKWLATTSSESPRVLLALLEGLVHGNDQMSVKRYLFNDLAGDVDATPCITTQIVCKPPVECAYLPLKELQPIGTSTPIKSLQLNANSLTTTHKDSSPSPVAYSPCVSEPTTPEETSDNQNLLAKESLPNGHHSSNCGGTVTGVLGLGQPARATEATECALSSGKSQGPEDLQPACALRPSAAAAVWKAVLSAVVFFTLLLAALLLLVLEAPFHHSAISQIRATPEFHQFNAEYYQPFKDWFGSVFYFVSDDNPWLCPTCNKPLPPSVLYQRQAPCQQETQSRKARISRVQSDPGVALKHHASSSTPDVIKKFVSRSIRRSKSMCVQKNGRDVEEPTMEVVSRLSKEILRIHLSILVPHTKSPPPKPKAFTVTEV
ncbi:hypothetical protein Bbelb_295750 [Branchiostoma belcheri]|nr:hypothetical protein Bbelb_295750 [Branchiostoma belcheri]